MSFPNNPEEKKAVIKFLKEASTALTRAEAEKDFIKVSKEDLSEETGLNKKILGRLLKAYHKGNFEAEQSEFSMLQDLFEAVTS